MAAVYLITLQGLLTPGDPKIFYESSDIDALLDNAEEFLDPGVTSAMVDAFSIRMLRNVRRNVSLSLGEIAETESP